jgi:hypothetical protein
LDWKCIFFTLQEADLHSSTGEPWLIPVIIGILVSLVVSLILLVRFCCVRPAAHKKLLKAAELGVPRPDLLHPSLQFDNKVIPSPQFDNKVYQKNTVGSRVPDPWHFGVDPDPNMRIHASD